MPTPPRLDSPTLPAIALLCMLAHGVASDADWPCWRGPGRNGVAEGGPTLRARFDGAPLEPVWTSEEILSGREGGYGSPVVAAGRVYVYCCWRTRHPVSYRVLRAETLSDLGVLKPAGLPDALHQRIEQARVSAERTAVAPDDLDRWMEAWNRDHVPSADRAAIPSLSSYVTDRLRRGAQALPVETLQTLATIVDRKFDGPGALDAWAAHSGIDAELWRSAIRPRLPDYERTEQDILFCLDAASGRTLWKRAQPTHSTKWSSSTTPCVAGDAVLFVGARGVAYCLDAATGDERWRQSLASDREGGAGYNSSFAAWRGKAYLLLGQLFALDVATGKILWHRGEARGHNSSPVLWHGAERSALIAGESGSRWAFDASTGDPLWKIDAPGQGTPAVSGDLMAVQHPHGLVAFRLSADGARRVAASDRGHAKGGSPIIHGTRVYSGSWEPACLDADSGRPLWTGPRGLDPYASPALVDGRLWCLGRRQLVALDLDSGKQLAQARLDFLRCASPAFADGRLFVRTAKAVVCHDLRAAR